MAKRFIDTGIFDDVWFMDLTKEGKILWLYFITKCDHAGILRMNMKLCVVQTGIKDILTVIKELGNRLVIVNEQLFFIPKFLDYQYPGFPDCKFKAAKSAIDILEKYNLLKDGKLTVTKELPNSYGIGIGIGIGNGNGKGNGKEEKLKIEEIKSSEQTHTASTGKKKSKTDPFPYIKETDNQDQNLVKKWAEWYEYHKLIKKPYKTEKGAAAAYNKLLTLSDSNSDTAIAIINQSMENEWLGLFPLKTNGHAALKSSTMIEKARTYNDPKQTF